MDPEDIVRNSTRVPKALWSNITIRSNISYVLVGDQHKAERFRIGGYVSSVETSPRAAITTTAGVVYLDEVEEIYKSSDQFNIEFYLITQSLLTMRQEVEKLKKQIKTLTNMIDKEET